MLVRNIIDQKRKRVGTVMYLLFSFLRGRLDYKILKSKCFGRKKRSFLKVDEAYMTVRYLK